MKEDEACSFCSEYFIHSGGGGVKIPLFQNKVMLHIKLKGMTNAFTCKQIFCPYTHPQNPQGRGFKGENIFSESSYVAYQNNGNEA